MRQLSITFDIDWAPDWSILLCAQLCVDRNIPATFFVTHDTPVLAELRAMPGIELGIHPNFQPGSSQGATISDVLSFCMQLVPEARSMRTHNLVQSTSILAAVARETPIERDVSLLLPFHPGLVATRLHLAAGLRPLLRFPYFWEDDVAAVWPDWDWNAGCYDNNGLMIFDFHPIHIALNTADMSGYHSLKRDLGESRLQDLTPEHVQRYAAPRSGARSFLDRVLRENPPEQFRAISALEAPTAPVTA